MIMSQYRIKSSLIAIFALDQHMFNHKVGLNQHMFNREVGLDQHMSSRELHRMILSTRELQESKVLRDFKRGHLDERMPI